MRTLTSIASLQKITATGALTDLDVRGLLRSGTFSLHAKSDAGTNPTLDVKLQHAGVEAVGQSYTTSGTNVDDELREGASTKVQLAAKFTQSGTKSIKYVDLLLKKGGTLTAGKLLTLTINTNSAGVPSATVVGTANTVDIDTLVSTSYAWVRFTFPTAVDLTDATIYHLVLTGDYTASATNNVMWRSATVASAGNQSTHNGTIWAAVTTQSACFINWDMTFADVTSGSFTQVTTSTSFQKLHFSLDGLLNGFVRPYATIGGTATPAFYLAVAVNAESRTA